MKQKRRLAILGVCLFCVLLAWKMIDHGEIRGPGDMEFYEAHCNASKFSEIMTGRNGDKKQDHYLSVNFIQTSGPLALEIQVLSKEPNVPEYTLVESFSAEFGKGRVTVIPAGHAFQVLAKATEGRAGTPTLQIIMSEGAVR